MSLKGPGAAVLRCLSGGLRACLRLPTAVPLSRITSSLNLSSRRRPGQHLRVSESESASAMPKLTVLLRWMIRKRQY